ncbi:hypothetical protein [Halarcobacter sp.]|uniref:hypothetical protein n=1 Tax=Halarcobacter sp. TaxID=2321133 RepID=UPI002AAAD142|nr:hypothetical protein [Halarcobacter sp.]
MNFEHELEDEHKKNSGTPSQKGGFKTSKNEYENSSNNFASKKNKSNSSSKNVAKSSINFQKVNIHAFKHNAREEEEKKKAATIFEEFTKDNEFDIGSNEALKKFNEMYKVAKENRLKRGLNKTADKKNTLWEAIVNLKTEHKLNDVQELAKKIEKETGFQTIQVAIHKDEGQEKEGKLIRKNHHAHISFFTLDKEIGQQMYRREHMNRTKLIKLQDIVAEHLGMQRGERGSKAKRLGHKEYKSVMKEKEEYQEKLRVLKQAINNEREELKKQKATRPEYAKLEQVNKDLKRQLEFKEISLEELKDLIDEKVKTIDYQNKKLISFEQKERDSSLTVKGEITKERVTISKGILKKEERYIYNNSSVESYVVKSKGKEKELNRKVEQLEKSNSILKEKANQYDRFKIFAKAYFKTSDFSKVKDLIKQKIPKVKNKINNRHKSLDTGYER